GTVIIVAGSVNAKEVASGVTKHFGKVHTGSKGGKVKTKDKQSKPNLIIKHKVTDQTHFVLGVRTFPLKDKRNVTLSVLSALLGAGMSSRLFIKLREELGVAYYVRAYNDPSLDHGAFQISAGVNNTRTTEVLKVILQECTRLTYEKVTDQELAKVKSFIIGNTKLALEATDDIANFYGTQELMKGEIKTLDQKIKDINAVTGADIMKVAKTIFQTKHLNLALIGPFKDKVSFSKILKF
ncbi:MAG: insulinase family protein, partial [Patescibacteria group bacterium]